MLSQLSQAVANHVEAASHLYHRLVLLAGPPRSGKTLALLELHEERSWPLVNINLALSEKLLELPARQRARRAADLVADIVGETSADVVLLDNLELLFLPALKQDPLRLLQRLSRDRTITAAWRGSYQGKSLTYASPDHPEFRRFEDPQALILSSGSHPASRGAASAQEPSI